MEIVRNLPEPLGDAVFAYCEARGSRKMASKKLGWPVWRLEDALNRAQRLLGSDPAKLRAASERKKPTVVEWQGERLTIAEAARSQGLDPGTVRSRLYAGWTLEESLTTPAGGKRRATAEAA